MATIQLPPDFSAFLSLLNSSGIRRLVVGGFAAAHHGYPRATGDPDLWLVPDAAEEAALRDAIIGFGLPREFRAASRPTSAGSPCG